jgi:DnaJ-class molecular chaperone
MSDDRSFEDMAPGDEAPPGTEGTGEDVCPNCNGSGSADGATCPECEGKGTVVRGVGGA